MFIRYVSCHTLRFCFTILPNVFSVMYINTNHITGCLQISSFVLFFYIFCLYFFFSLFFYSLMFFCLMNSWQLMTVIYQLKYTYHVIWVNLSTLENTFMIAVFTNFDFELFKNCNTLTQHHAAIGKFYNYFVESYFRSLLFCNYKFISCCNSCKFCTIFLF